MNRLPDELKREIVNEIERAVGLHGEQDGLPQEVWLAIATEEVGEIAQGVLKEGFGRDKRSPEDQATRELHTDEEIVQTISVLIHWLMIRRAKGGR